MYKKTLMFCTFTKTNTMNIICIFQNTWPRWVQLYSGEIAGLLDNDGAWLTLILEVMTINLIL